MLVGLLDTQLKSGAYVALGFESPQYIPRRMEQGELLRQRTGEAGRPWSAGAGAGVLVVGLAQAQWVLTQLHTLNPTIRGTTRWAEFASGEAQILLWEAFVSSTTQCMFPPGHILKRSEHEQDAASAVATLHWRLQSDTSPQSDLEGQEVLSLAGLQLVSAGLATDIALLREPCIVIKAGKPWWPGMDMSGPEQVWAEIEERDYLQPMATAWDRVYRTLRSAWEADPRGMGEPPMLMILGGAAFVTAEDRADQWTETIRWAKRYGIDPRYVALGDNEKFRR